MQFPNLSDCLVFQTTPGNNLSQLRWSGKQMLRSARGSGILMPVNGKGCEEAGKGTESFQRGFRSDTTVRKGCRKQNWARRTSSHDADPSKLESIKWKVPEPRVSDR